MLFYNYFWKCSRICTFSKWFFFVLSIILSGSFSPWSINIPYNDSDAKQWLNNWTMEDWTQARDPVFGAKLSRLQTLSARANKQTTQIWRKQKLVFCTKQSSFCQQIFSPLSLIEFRPQTCSKGTCHSFLWVHAIVVLQTS